MHRMETASGETNARGSQPGACATLRTEFSGFTDLGLETPDWSPVISKADWARALEGQPRTKEAVISTAVWLSQIIQKSRENAKSVQAGKK